ncbi:multicopper oxidase, type 1 [Ceratocystis lukuohia]|uniref:Multicopper oxidase, type 1 n=1 Tax=Ceratocystis lukuohia TaxID=2019550 RepID=A0ABR4M8W4_9PEZI
MDATAEDAPFLPELDGPYTRDTRRSLELQEEKHPEVDPTSFGLLRLRRSSNSRLCVAVVAGVYLLLLAAAIALVGIGIHLSTRAGFMHRFHSRPSSAGINAATTSAVDAPTATSISLPEHGSSGSDSDSKAGYQYHETTPPTAQLRNMEEYIIDPAWDYSLSPAVREYFWVINDAELNPDGVFRPMVLINNQFPGPLIEVNSGDNIVVHVDNRGINATSIHFHGIFQNGTNAMDGTVGITQCPIAPGTTYTYNFTVSGQSGTYWYHAHYGSQASDGVFGPMVVHAANEKTELQKLDYVSDRVVMVHDHYHDTTAQILMDYLAPGRENDEPVPESAMINGRGVRNCTEFPDRKCDDSSVGFPEIQLQKEARHRLRIINTGAFGTFQLQIDQHPFYVTEVDGMDVFPEDFHRLEIMPAQRYSIVVEANSTESDEFWLRARFVTHCFSYDNPYMKPNIEGIVRYVDSGPPSRPPSALSSTHTALPTPTTSDWADMEVFCKDLESLMLHPVTKPTIPQSNDYIQLKASFRIGDWTLSRGFINTTTWHANISHPSLHRLLDASPAKQQLLPGGSPLNGVNDRLFDLDKEFVFQTRGAQTLDIAINNFDDGAHPFHLHGHKFWVLAESTTGYPPEKHELDEFLQSTNALDNPVMRDTVTVQAYQWALIRVKLENPGIWAFHCHNMWHAEAGMVMQFLVMPEELMLASGVGQKERELCQRPGIEKGMRPDDSIWEGII